MFNTLYCWLIAGNSSSAGALKNPWHCGLCKFQCSTRSEVLDHTSGVHGLKSQFKCGLCSYRSSSKASFDSHFASRHPAAENVELIHVYRKVCNHLYQLKTKDLKIIKIFLKMWLEEMTWILNSWTWEIIVCQCNKYLALNHSAWESLLSE